MTEANVHFFTDFLSNVFLANYFNKITDDLLFKLLLTIYLLCWMFIIKYLIGNKESSLFLVKSISTWIYFLAGIVILFCKNEDPKKLY